MSLQILSTPEQIIRANQELPDEARQNMLLLNFDPPIQKAFAWEFNRIKFTLGMRCGGEDDFYRPDVFQPSSARCSVCATPLQLVSQWVGKCLNARCLRFGREENFKPKRGVIEVQVPADRLRTIDGIEFCDSVVLVMDRRYRPEVLAAVYRTAGQICDEYGWKLR